MKSQKSVKSENNINYYFSKILKITLKIFNNK